MLRAGARWRSISQRQLKPPRLFTAATSGGGRLQCVVRASVRARRSPWWSVSPQKVRAPLAITHTNPPATHSRSACSARRE